MTKEEAKKILQCATAAPSGENVQPWKFIVKDNSIDVYNVPERDQSLYNWEQRASFIAAGAAIENIVIAAKEMGYTPSLSFFPEAAKKDFIARIELAKSDVEKDSLYPYIFERCTNRKRYETTPLSQEMANEIMASSFGNDECRFLFTQDDDKKKVLGKGGAMNETIMLSNKELHHFFFSHISWTKREDDEKKMGFYIPTLELPSAVIPMFKLFKRWPVTNTFNKLMGFSKKLGKQHSEFYANASGFGAIVINNKSAENFVHAGRMIQRIWLTATKMNLSLHPLTGILFFHLQVQQGNSGSFTKEHIQIIADNYEGIKQAFGVKDNETIAFMFRIGKGGKPSARSSRYTVEEVSEILV